MARVSVGEGVLLARTGARTVPRSRAGRGPAWVLSAAMLIVTAPAAVNAQDVSVRAYVTPGTSVGVGRPFTLNVEISGAQSVDREPVLPEVASFAQFLGSNTQSSMQMVNGRTSVTLTMQYRYQALSEGSFRIPAFEVAAAGRSFTTDPIDLTVSAAPQNDPGRPAGGIGADDLFVTAQPSTGEVREGEPFVVEYRLWTRIDVSNYSLVRVPEPEGFWVEDITPEGRPTVETRTRDGAQYTTAVIRRVALIPTGAGERTIESIGVEAQVRVQNTRDPFRDFFGRSSLFGTTVPTTVLSNALTFDVLPLPPGRPEPFSGVVGSLSVSAGLDRDSVDANQAVTLTVRVSGEGNLRAVQPPSLDFPPDFEVFPPEVTESVRASSTGLSGSKTFEYVLIPRAPGRREIPSARFAYLDAASGSYRTVESGTLPLTVSGVMPEGPGLGRGGVPMLREDIRFIRLGSLDLQRTGRSPFAGATFWIFALLPLVAVTGALGLRRHWDLLEGDVAYARGRRAGRVAKKRLEQARRLADGNDASAFYAEVARALRGLAADRLNMAEAGLQTAELDDALRRAGVGDGVREELLSCLDHCDRQRFAPATAESEERSRFLARAGDLMTRLDRAVR